jgi:signal transduction histidine kinase
MSKDSIRVLLIDDDPADIELSRRALSAIGKPRFVVESAQYLGQAIERIRVAKFDVALLDLGLPDSTGSRTLAAVREVAGDDLSIIVLTGLADEEMALQAIHHGAQDYIVKDEVTPNLLSRSIRYALQRQHLLKQLKATNGLLEQKNVRLAQLCDTAQQFVENVSHEFRTPLTVIREFTSIIRDGLDGPVTPKQSDHLGKVLHRTDDLALMVDDMLDNSKLKAGLLGVWRKPCQAGDLISNVVGLLKSRAASKEITLSVSVPDQLPAVFCDDEKARRVITNLTVNAIKFAPDGGRVDVWARPDDRGHCVEIGVSDNGPGISEENLELIFERFRQIDQRVSSSTKGFGLGLNIAKELVGLNLGEINVKSRPGAGSTFLFTLPLFEPQIVVDRFLDRLTTVYRFTSDVSLLSVNVDLNKPDATAVVDEFLQRSIRTTDLAMPAGKRRWVIAAACSEADCAHLVARLTREWTNFMRNCPAVKLPGLRIQRRATMSIAMQREQLVQAYLSMFQSEAATTQPMPTVLVVDDDSELSQCLALRLQSAGFHVVSASDGEEGIQVARAVKPNAIVLDVRMPKKDGLTALRELRTIAATKNTPIVMLSASIQDQQKALQAGANFFVRKPYEADEVLSAIESSLKEP